MFFMIAAEDIRAGDEVVMGEDGMAYLRIGRLLHVTPMGRATENLRAGFRVVCARGEVREDDA